MLGLITSQKRLDLAFETCMLSRSSQNSTVNKITKANKTFDKTKRENVILRFGFKGNIKNFKTIRFNEASSGNLSNGSLQSGYLVCLVNEVQECSPIYQKLEKLVLIAVLF